MERSKGASTWIKLTTLGLLPGTFRDWLSAVQYRPVGELNGRLDLLSVVLRRGLGLFLDLRYHSAD